MRKTIIWKILAALLLVVTLNACDKNNHFDGNSTIVGHLYQADTITSGLAIPLPGQKIYLNTADDTSTYVYFVTTDQAGRFSIPSVDASKTFILFSRLIKDGVEYKGATKITGGDNKGTITADLRVYASHTNGISVLFYDRFHGPIPRLPFRMYTSRTAAVLDSVSYAITDSSSDNRGLYEQFNINPAKYYIVSKKIFGSDTLRIFDSLTVKSSGIVKDTMFLQ